MCIRDSDGVGYEVVGQEVAVLFAAKGELEDLHAGEGEAVAQLLDFGGDDAQVFGDDGQIAHALLNGLEERDAGAIDPPALDGRRLGGRNLPVAGEAAEVVDAGDVGLHQICLLYTSRCV